MVAMRYETLSNTSKMHRQLIAPSSGSSSSATNGQPKNDIGSIIQSTVDEKLHTVLNVNIPQKEEKLSCLTHEPDKIMVAQFAALFLSGISLHQETQRESSFRPTIPWNVVVDRPSSPFIYVSFELSHQHKFTDANLRWFKVLYPLAYDHCILDFTRHLWTYKLRSRANENESLSRAVTVVVAESASVDVVDSNLDQRIDEAINSKKRKR
jgi:hypothetical protein